MPSFRHQEHRSNIGIELLTVELAKPESGLWENRSSTCLRPFVLKLRAFRNAAGEAATGELKATIVRRTNRERKRELCRRKQTGETEQSRAVMEGGRGGACNT